MNASSLSDIDRENACRFGHYVIPVGARLKLRSDKMKCKCITPPDLFCSRVEIVEEETVDITE